MAKFIKSHLDGTVSAISVESGAVIEAGERVADIEMMKMFHPVESPYAGTIRFLVGLGEVVAEGQIIARVD